MTVLRSYPTRALFWNIWGSRHPEALNQYLLREIHNNVDIMLLTEVTDTSDDSTLPCVKTSTRASEPVSYLDGLDRIKSALPKKFATEYFSPERCTWQCKVGDVSVTDVGFGSALLYNTKIIEPIAIRNTAILPYNHWGLRERNLQCIVFARGNLRYITAHLHGAWIEGNTKGDHPARLEQSTQVTLTLAALKAEFQVDKVVFGGDLNLDSNTHALRMLENGESVTPPLRLRNLVREFDIINTRTPEYRSYYDQNASQYADYVLVSSNVAVHDFWVENRTSISDHAPVHITFS